MARKKKVEKDPLIVNAAELVMTGMYGRGRELRKKLDKNYWYLGGSSVILEECYSRGYTEIG